MSKLTSKQEVFANEYLIDLNATAAYKRAGYVATGNSAEVNASKLLRNTKVAARVKELKDKRADELNLDAYWVLKRLKDVSDRAMQAEPVMMWDNNAKEMVPTGEYEFDSTGANKSTELIGKHIGMFDPKLKLQMKMLETQIEKTKAETEKIKGEDDSDETEDWVAAIQAVAERRKKAKG
jgi:phage terminase small subunit